MAEQELIVLGGYGGHHEAKDVHEGTKDEKVGGAIVVKDLACDGTAEKHEEGLQRRDPGDGTFRVLG